MLLFRKILFGIFTVIYIIVCPLLILYSLGYVYNPIQQELVQTGIVSLSTLPQGAFVFLENSRYIHKTPVDIRELLPGTYSVTLKKKGFKPWTHSISVDAGKAVAFNNILLIPDNWTIKNLTQENFKDIVPLENNQYKFLASTGNTLGSFFTFDKDEIRRPLVDSNSPYAEISVNKIYNMPKSRSLLISAETFWDKKTLFLNLDETEPVINDITKMFSARPSFVLWQEKDAEQIYTVFDNCINRIDILEEQVFNCRWNNIKGFGLHENWLYLIDSNNTLLRELPESKKQQILSQDDSVSKTLFDRSNFYQITVKNGFIVFLGSSGDLIANVPPYNIASQGIIGLSFHSDAKLLLCWSKKFVSVVDFSPKFDKSLFHEKFTVKTIYEDAKNIKQCFWAYKDSHILLNNSETVCLIEIEPQGPNHVETLCRIKKDTNIFYDADKYTLYYLDEKTGILKKIRIFPD